MSKVIFMLDSREDEHEMWEMMNAWRMSGAIVDFDQTLRNILKYDADDLSEDEIKGIERARSLLHENLEARDVIRVLDT